jgi:hypothetical protein
MYSMAKVLFALLLLAIAGCSNLEPRVRSAESDIYTLERTVSALQETLRKLTGETEAEINRLRGNDSALYSRIQSLEVQLAEARRKLDTFCVVTRNGKWDRFRPSGDTECHIR